MIGIYKITSPTGRIYIGQSRDIERRFATYRLMRCESQPKVFRSLFKHGVDSHLFDIMIECIESELNYWETFYIKLFNSFSSQHLNCRMDGEYKVISEETRLKLSKALRGMKRSAETCKKMSLIMTGKPSPKRGCKVPRESVEKQRASLIGKMAGDKNPFFGKKHSEETLVKMRARPRGVGGENVKAKLVLNLETGIYYDCAKDAATSEGRCQHQFRKMLSGWRRNKTSFIYA